MDDTRFAHHEYLADVAGEDVRFVLEKDRSYGASWKRRGGIGVFMMLARKWDRLEQMLGAQFLVHERYDILGAIEAKPGGEDGTVLAEVRDLRRYLLLVEAEMIARGVVADPDDPKIPQEPRRPALVDMAPEVQSEHIRGVLGGLAPGWRTSERTDRSRPRLSTKLDTIDWLGLSPEDKGLYYHADHDGHYHMHPSHYAERGRSVVDEVTQIVQPGTPEDGGQHARYRLHEAVEELASRPRTGDPLSGNHVDVPGHMDHVFQISVADYQDLEDEGDRCAYRRHATDAFRLQEVLPTDRPLPIPTSAVALMYRYSVYDDGRTKRRWLILDAARLSPERRGQVSPLQAELNQKEHSMLPHWHAPLYDRDPHRGTMRLRPEFAVRAECGRPT